MNAFIRKMRKMITLLGWRQSIKFCFHYAQNSAEPIALTIAGISTPLLCRVCDSDPRVLWQVFGEKWFDLNEIEPPRLIIDGGAYIGYTSVFFANKYPNAHIIAVEPSAENAQLLRKNCAAYDNIELVQAAVWSSDTGLRIENPDDESWMLRVAEAGDGQGMPMLRGVNLETLLNESGFEAIDLLKLDIEGGERSVFSRSTGWLSRTRHMLIELHERYFLGCEEAFSTAIQDEPFRVSQDGEYTVLIRPKSWRPSKHQLSSKAAPAYASQPI